LEILVPVLIVVFGKNLNRGLTQDGQEFSLDCVPSFRRREFTFAWLQNVLRRIRVVVPPIPSRNVTLV
jgi:hypothetical protein